MSSATDHRRGPRRRGAELEDAILRAAREGLIERGYAALTMDWIASRARTSKAALYRRWSNRAELVVYAQGQLVRSLLSTPDTGSFASDMHTLLRSLADLMDSEYGELLRGVLAEVTKNPELAAETRRQLLATGPYLVDEIYQRGIERGEVRPELRGTRAMTVAHDLLRNEFVIRGTPITDAVIKDILDTIYLPLVRVQ
ncbi:TetR/AcrR family transcriptional regulator [Streptomyces iranensis]|uniref:AcrR family transcriptional regulator n=1 Tax=Streptomyces iranensis TaxID=576784 RepID=A0A060ZHU8_9ACTN|nr:TetR/AcrR family transcriptional regulator [Streptomyces iranensis]MBP2061123.1 AcrR family transcriptional regulator [Streptomyces iranensis]CDR05610.1 TetR family transcriptional regulator [Streptomyces iranensis]